MHHMIVIFFTLDLVLAVIILLLVAIRFDVNCVFCDIVNRWTTESTRHLYERKLEEAIASDRTFYREEGSVFHSDNIPKQKRGKK